MRFNVIKCKEHLLNHPIHIPVDPLKKSKKLMTIALFRRHNSSSASIFNIHTWIFNYSCLMMLSTVYPIQMLSLKASNFIASSASFKKINIYSWHCEVSAVGQPQVPILLPLSNLVSNLVACNFLSCCLQLHINLALSVQNDCF